MLRYQEAKSQCLSLQSSGDGWAHEYCHMEAHLTELYGLGKEDWQSVQQKITGRGDGEKGLESLLSQNGMCTCEACSIWAGPQVEKSWVCGDGEMVRRGWDSIPVWGTWSIRRVGQKEHVAHLSSSWSVDGSWGVMWCVVEKVLCGWTAPLLGRTSCLLWDSCQAYATCSSCYLLF